MDPLRPGDPRQAGEYRLLGRLGEGGMGQVFFGRSPGGRPVAVKLIRDEYAHRAHFRARFAREVEAARRVGGFHTALVIAADPDADPPWMATAYIPGPSLHHAVTEHGPLGVRAVRILGAGLAEGLAAIHACGLVHRDLKPGNVILAADGPRIIDFGIARTRDAGTITATGAFLGTYAYMSPEQVNGHPAEAASDVFALGAVLAFAATGHGPFDAETVAAVLRRITGEPPDLHDLDIDRDLRDLVAACLAKDPAGRPPLADVLARLSGPWPGDGWLPPAVQDMITSRASESEAERPPYDRSTEDPVPERRRGRRSALVAGGAAAVVAGAAVAVALALPESGATSPPARRHFVTDDGRAFGPGGRSTFRVTVDPRNTGVRLTRRLDSSVAGQSAWISVNGVRAGRWAPLDGALTTWMDQTVELSRTATRGARVLTVTNTYEASTKDFNEFTYTVDERVGGAWRRAAVVDVGPGHRGEEKAHRYRISGQTWQGTRTFSYRDPSRPGGPTVPP